ncbi:DNA phosphorothioation-associated putative methyltransferase [Methylobacterium oryzihabitans]|uniref:DNA phosphorothioation-associated putative methyltransferase n=1 Tax=Methylobacterium oryzihabitans TaxID=2499852 RepID=A0A437P899_9HYPH|nr:DNA phosphorothioation-associated putative methyltransferase [Methylobacterium oryzihabitans]RVU18493.1 DNA phosphorothioation-associated putative methyltransferase [Methylobacterium oryzihabitans]
MEARTAVARHRTALSRIDLSRPIRLALEDGLVHGTVLDYGCGRGGDVRALTAVGVDCVGWDPAHRPDGARRPSDLVNLGYVINVIERVEERRDTLLEAWALAQRVLIVSARLVAEAPTAGRTLEDGYLTRLGTFQKFYEQQELRTWIDTTLGELSVAAAPGVFYVFRDRREREAFVASRYRRSPDRGPIAGLCKIEHHRPMLEALAGFVLEHGRLPGEDEVELAREVAATLGSVRRAGRLLAALGLSDPDLTAARLARSEDLLVYLALARLDRRSAYGELPRSLQIDVKVFFGTYGAATKAADTMLFALGDADRRDAACREARVGKLMPTALYVHVDAIARLPLPLRLYEGCARHYIGAVPEATIVKLGRHEPKVSYLTYPTFESDPHPALQASVSAHLQTFRVRQRSFASNSNPPILHRKELFVETSHPSRPKFERLTRQEERLGLFDEPSTIGTRDGWAAALDARGLVLRGHRILRRAAPDAKPAT